MPSLPEQYILNEVFLFTLQETDRGRHEKGSKTRIGLYTIESEGST